MQESVNGPNLDREIKRDYVIRTYNYDSGEITPN